MRLVCVAVVDRAVLEILGRNLRRARHHGRCRRRVSERLLEAKRTPVALGLGGKRRRSRDNRGANGRNESSLDQGMHGSFSKCLCLRVVDPLARGAELAFQPWLLKGLISHLRTHPCESDVTAQRDKY